MEIVTGSTGRTHVTPIDDAIRNGNVGYVTEEVVLDVYTDNAQSDNFTATKYNNNTVRVGRGYGMMQGRLFKILDNSYDDVNIVNGTQGKKRADLIVAHYEMDSSTGFETITLEAIQGAAGSSYVDPEYTTGNINQGDTENDMPLYRVKLDGIQIEEVEQLFTLVPDGGRVGVIEKKIESDLITDLARETAGNLTDTGTEIGVKGLLPITHGGTGQATAQAAFNALANGATSDTTDITDAEVIITKVSGTWYQKSFAKIWGYVQSKIQSVLGLTSANYGGNAASATVAGGLSNTLGVAKGGTGKASVTSGKALVGNGTSALQEWDIDTAPNSGHNQALITSKAVADAIGQAGYGDMLKSTYDSDNDGAIDVEAGGTGAKTPADARENLGAASETDLSNLSDSVTAIAGDLGDFEESITGKVSDNAPYLLRKGKGNLADITLEGYSLPVNQLYNYTKASETRNGITCSVTNGVISLSGIADATGNNVTFAWTDFKIPKGHKVYVTKDFDLKNNDIITDVYNANYADIINKVIAISDSTGYLIPQLVINTNGGNYNNVSGKLYVYDLTQRFGTDIADHIYSKEQSSAGSGIAWIKSYGFLSKDYEPFNLGSIQSVKTSGRKVVGKNLFDFEGWLRTNNIPYSKIGNAYTFNTTTSLFSNPFTFANDDINISLSSTISLVSATNVGFVLLDKNNNAVSGRMNAGNNYKCSKIRLDWSQSGTITITEPMIRLASVTDVTYEPYTSTTVALPNEDLRGILKRDGDNLYAYGDTDKGDGQKNVRFIELDLGDYTFTAYDATNKVYSVSLVSADVLTGTMNLTCSKGYERYGGVIENITDKSMRLASSGKLYIRDTAYTDATAFNTAMNGVKLVVEAYTPTIESSTPWQNPQRAYLDGTEEFIDNRDVPLPVGHTSVYQLNETLPPIEDYVDGAVKNINYRQPDIEYTLQTGEILYTAITNMHIDDKKITPFAVLVLEDTHGDTKEHILHYARKSVTSGTMLILFREFPMIGITPPYIAGITFALRKELEEPYMDTYMSCDYCLELGFSISNSGGDLDIDIVQNDIAITLQAGDVVKFYY